MRTRLLLPCLLASSLVLVTACAGGGKDEPSGPKLVFGGDRPVTLKVPAAYDGSTAVPLVLVLHGYGFDGSVQENYFAAGDLVDDEGVLLASPDGTINPNGDRFWNGTDFCCDFYESGVDDAGYLRGLIEEIQAEYAVDPKRVFVMGHSNGAFMAYRLACESADLVAGIVGLAGTTFADPADCAPSEPVSVLHIHGDLDDTIAYAGATVPNAGTYPGAVATVETWGGYDGCTGVVGTAGTFDLDASIGGEETTISNVGGCASPTGVTLWTIEGGSHIPTWNGTFASHAWGWLEQHPKP